MNLTVYDMKGKQVGSLEIDPADIAPSINQQLLHDAVVMYQANLRQGTHKTKTRGEVAGSTRKLYRQKGTGNARAGARRSGTRRGGGHIFAKSPRDFGWRMPRKSLQAATRMALASRLADEEVVVVDGLSVESPKTATVARMLRSLGVADQTVLVSPDAHDPALWKSARNIQGVVVEPVADLNALSLLKSKRVIMTKAGLETFRAAGEAARVAKSKKVTRRSASPKTGGKAGSSGSSGASKRGAAGASKKSDQRASAGVRAGAGVAGKEKK
ncbi:MAG: 50S ribosomal protein L4 [Planctomycetaceae bacterium]